MTDLEHLQANWNYPCPITFGVGRITELVACCHEFDIQKPLLITDTDLFHLDFVKNIIKLMSASGLGNAVFSDVDANPTEKNILEGIAMYKQGDHDGVIALGGGSALDAGKTIALVARQQRPLWDFEDVGDNWQRANVSAMATVIAIPTTAGTGSEVGRAAVIVDTTTQTKKIIFHPKMLPAQVIADPELTQSLPPHITAATGLDAFVHNFEAYCAPGYHPMADGIALEGMRLIKQCLPAAYKNGSDLVARSHMLIASSMGATAFQKGLGAVHALAHPLGALYNKHHGLLNAILLPYVVLRNKPAICERTEHIARCLQLNDTSFTGFFQWLLEFRRDLGIPNALLDIGINADDKEHIAQMALQDSTAGTNPVKLVQQDYVELFENAVHGRLA